MHHDKARKITAGLAGFAFGFTLVNIFAYGGNPEGIFTFLYIGTVLALIGSAFMIAATSLKEDTRDSIMNQKMIAIIALLIIDVVFAIPSFQWVSRFAEFGTSDASVWIFRWIAAVALQSIATAFFIFYAKMHVGRGANIGGGYIAAPMGVHH